jgi:hypothetical protein
MSTTPNMASETATASELADAILSWADQRRPLIFAAKRSPSWTSVQLRDFFRANLERNLLTAVAVTKRAAFIAQLGQIFSASGSSNSLAVIARHNVSEYDDRHGQIFQSLRTELADIIADSHSATVTDIGSDRAAELITKSLRQALAQEAKRVPATGGTPEAVLRSYLVPSEVKRQYSARTFLAFLGLAVLALLLFALIEPDSWISPATSFFVLCAYITLVATCAVQEYTTARSQ